MILGARGKHAEDVTQNLWQPERKLHRCPLKGDNVLRLIFSSGAKPDGMSWPQCQPEGRQGFGGDAHSGVGGTHLLLSRSHSVAECHT